MPKRGDRLRYGYRYTWTNGVTGVRRFHDRESRDREADEQRSRIGPNGERCTVKILPDLS